jgi:hypothetical protein
MPKFLLIPPPGTTPPPLRGGKIVILPKNSGNSTIEKVVLCYSVM